MLSIVFLMTQDRRGSVGQTGLANVVWLAVSGAGDAAGTAVRPCLGSTKIVSDAGSYRLGVFLKARLTAITSTMGKERRCRSHDLTDPHKAKP